MDMAALPEGPVVLTCPAIHHPSRIGSPSSARTGGLASARATASRKTSVCRNTVKKTRGNSARIARQPAGTTHFQWRCHQLGGGAGWAKGSGRDMAKVRLGAAVRPWTMKLGAQAARDADRGIRDCGSTYDQGGLHRAELAQGLTAETQLLRMLLHGKAPFS